METRDRLFIGNEWVAPATDSTIDVISPITEEVYARTPDGSPGDIDRAVAAAREAFDDGPWPNSTPEERADAIAALSQALQKRAAEIAEVITNENGAPAQQSLGTQAFAATMVLDLYADITRTYPWSDERVGAMGEKVVVRRAPVGVCAGIIPWNVPLFIMAMKLGPCLASGSTMVIKPAPETALDPYLLADAVLEAGLPPGVVNIVTASREASEHIVTHPGIDKVSFTGSTATGSRIGELCGAQIKRVTLELGGKSAAILLDDVDIEAQLQNILMSGLLNNGQACAAQTRILAPRSRYQELVDALAAGVGAMAVGDPNDPATAVGPVVAERQRDKIVGMLAAGKERGRQGGGRRRHSRTSGQGLVHRADCLLRRRQRDAHRPRRDLRPGVVGHSLRHRRRRGAHRQRFRLRPVRFGVDGRRRSRRPGRGPPAHRHRPDQLGIARRFQGAVRRLQEVGSRPRVRPRGHRPLHRVPVDHLPQLID